VWLVCTKDAEARSFVHTRQAKAAVVHTDPPDPQFDIDHSIAVQNHNTFERRLQPNLIPGYPDDNGPYLPPPPRITEPFSAPHPRDIDRDFLDTIEDNQDDIRDTRERLVGVRFRLRTKRRELKATREDAVVKAGVAFSRVKTFLLMQSLELPPDIQKALDDADTSRDILGTQETEYEEAEDSYNLEEWLYSDKETKFVDNLFSTLQSSPITIGQPPDRFGQTQTSQIPPSVERFGPALPTLPVLSRANALVHDVLPSYEASEHAEYVEKLQVYESPEPLERALESVSLHDISLKAAYIVEPFNRSQSENDLNLARQKWSQTRDRIDKWMLEAVDDSRFQKAQLRNQLSKPNLNDKDWWRLVVEHWRSTSPSLSAFHTGDTTVLASTTSEPASAKSLQKSLGDLELVETEDGPSTATPLVQDDRHVDALEVIDFPSDLKLSEVFGRTPKRVTFLGSDQSISSQLTINTCVFSETESSSVSSNSANDHPHHGSILARGGLRLQTQPSHTKSQPRRKLEDINHALIHSKLTRFAVQSIEDRIPSSRNMFAHQSDEHSPARVAHILGTGTTSTSMARSRTRHPFPVYIKVEGPKPWNLPLLRLTPLAPPMFKDSPTERSVQHFWNTPFVSISGSPARLPGPSNLPGFAPADVYL
jgi:hypothetical protein